MKKSYIAILILSIINSIVLVGTIVIQIVNNIKTIDSTELFKNNIDSIVEVKATTYTQGMTVRQYINTLLYEQQYKFGLDILTKFASEMGITPFWI